MSISLVIVGVWLIFLGSVWANWLSISAHSLGVLTVIVGIVILLLEVVLPLRGRRANP